MPFVITELWYVPDSVYHFTPSQLETPQPPSRHRWAAFPYHLSLSLRLCLSVHLTLRVSPLINTYKTPLKEKPFFARCPLICLSVFPFGYLSVSLYVGLSAGVCVNMTDAMLWLRYNVTLNNNSAFDWLAFQVALYIAVQFYYSIYNTITITTVNKTLRQLD